MFSCFSEQGRIRGFTLIELLVVISIVSLLSSIVLSSLNSAREKARVGAARSFAAQVDRVAGDQAVGWWDFDECTLLAAADRSGGANTASLANGSDWSPDTPSGSGCSILFVGSDDEVVVPTANLIGVAAAFTISAWIKPTDTTLEAIYGEFTANGDNTRNFLLLNQGKLVFDQWPSTGGSALASTRNIPLNKWTHVAYAQNGSERSLYIDGVLETKDSAAETYLGPTPTNARIGFRGSNQLIYSYQGRIDQVRAYTKSLSASEVGKIYAEEIKHLMIAYE